MMTLMMIFTRRSHRHPVIDDIAEINLGFTQAMTSHKGAGMCGEYITNGAGIQRCHESREGREGIDSHHSDINKSNTL
jgi:hypothetical protein